MGNHTHKWPACPGAAPPPEAFLTCVPPPAHCREYVTGFRKRKQQRRKEAVRSLEERQIEQCSQPAASANLRAGPSVVIGQSLPSVQFELAEVELPDRLAFVRAGEIKEENSIKPLSPRKFRRQPRDVIAGRHEIHIARVVVHPGE